MKHSQAKNVEVCCSTCTEKKQEYIFVTVADDGCGISQEKMNNFGIGLNSMQYRANQIGADFSITALRQAQGPLLQLKTLLQSDWRGTAWSSNQFQNYSFFLRKYQCRRR